MADLLTAVHSKDTTRAIQLLDTGADILHQSVVGNNLLMIACLHGLGTLVQRFLMEESASVLVNHMNQNGDNCVLWACASVVSLEEIERILILLFASGAKIMANKDGITPFMMIMKKVEPEKLLNLLVKVDDSLLLAKDKFGRNVLHFAFTGEVKLSWQFLEKTTSLLYNIDDEKVSPFDMLRNRNHPCKKMVDLLVDSINRERMEKTLAALDDESTWKVSKSKKKKSKSSAASAQTAASNTVPLHPNDELPATVTLPFQKFVVNASVSQNFDAFTKAKLQISNQVESEESNWRAYLNDNYTYALDLHLKHYFGHQLHALSSAQFEALSQFHLDALKKLELAKEQIALAANSAMLAEMNALRIELYQLKHEVSRMQSEKGS